MNELVEMSCSTNKHLSLNMCGVWTLHIKYFFKQNNSLYKEILYLEVVSVGLYSLNWLTSVKQTL